MKKEDNGKKSMAEFFEKKGYYIILAVCICIIGVSGVIVARSNINNIRNTAGINYEGLANETSSMNDGNYNRNSDNEGYVSASPNAAGYDNNKPSPTVTASPAATSATSGTTVSPSTKPSATPNSNGIKVPSEPKEEKPDSDADSGTGMEQMPKITTVGMPVVGEIILGYAMGSDSVYNKTLGDWRSHSGIDIAGELGGAVKAASAGVIEKIYNDDNYGTTIIIDHGNGIKTLYGNLSTDSMVQVKQKVNAGDVISGIGTSALNEIADEPHIHFEILVDGKNIDPKTFIK